MYKEQIMRLEFDKEDLNNEIKWWKSKVFPDRQNQQVAEFKPLFSRTSVGRARVELESRNKNQSVKPVEKK